MLILTDVKKVELEDTTPPKERRTAVDNGLGQAIKFNKDIYKYRVYFNNSSETPLVKDVSSLEIK